MGWRCLKKTPFFLELCNFNYYIYHNFNFIKHKIMNKGKENKGLSIEFKIVILILTSIFLFWCWFLILKPLKEQYNIKIGDVYKYTIKDDNPFNESKIHYYKVIDKRDNYVKYIDLSNKDTMTMKVRTFLYGVEKVKK